MTKHLILFRHGKSDWEASFSCDHDRPVAERGMVAARAMGKLLAAADWVPDLAITSSAVRARTTLELAMAAGQWQCPVQVADCLYEASVEDVLAVIHQAPDPCNCLLLVGHEPTWSDTASSLLGGATVQVPTAALVGLEFEVETWPQVEPRCGTLLWLLPPKLLTPSLV
ncbi:MAG: histidine phosphatase family protein [Nodosilinea sp.]